MKQLLRHLSNAFNTGKELHCIVQAGVKFHIGYFSILEGKKNKEQHLHCHCNKSYKLISVYSFSCSSSCIKRLKLTLNDTYYEAIIQSKIAR